jgi:hypothetical protein
MTGKGWITGEDIRSRGYSHIPDEDWNRIFNKSKKIHNSRMGVGETCDGCIEIAIDKENGNCSSN